MRKRFIFIGLFGAWALFIALVIDGIFPFYEANFYWFTIPFIIHSAISSCISGSVYWFPSLKQQNIALFLAGTLPITWWFAAAKWPGGDDGPGGAWFLVLGFSCFICLAYTIWATFQNSLERGKQ